ncbi:MerR family transcriptional regulator [Candidatus Mycobacterium methanotrophicum]|uniref:MerR family transcriptional regulator n=1 Tax=Candidatus Mycobacterium methanotrophicum TaxID=2943498 RepID=A0ABY4QSA3_9MYCO|nr:MerR family transcriptional regulator [Candidatus Mycobacterium methanotrophicum]UQX13193.1 MerR family transcriptional regulator [Candidatus Mycobacterium methanotrophicum]
MAVVADLDAPRLGLLYERRGLLSPARTAGSTRRYSDNDLQRLQRITELVDQGVNLAGIAQILDLETKNSQLQAGYTALKLLNAKLKADRKPAVDHSAAGKNEGSAWVAELAGGGSARAALADRDHGAATLAPVG